MISAEVRQVAPADAFEALKTLKSQGYNMLVDMTTIDFSAIGKGEKGDGSEPLKRAAPAERQDSAHAIASADGEEYGTPKLAGPKHDYLKPRPERFEVIWRLMKLDLESGQDLGRVELRCFVCEGKPVLRSAASLWPIADWLEREQWDMFGIGFVDRPEIKRLYLYEEFKGHPLRKVYPITLRQPLIGPPSGEPKGNPSFNRIEKGVDFE